MQLGNLLSLMLPLVRVITSHALKPLANLHRGMLNSSDVFVLDLGNEVFVWVGSGSSPDEKRYSMQHTEWYLKQNNRPAQLSITKVIEGNEPESFFAALH